MHLLKNEKLIFDNAVLSNFSRIGKIELIFHFSSNLYTTKEVVQEINSGILKYPALGTILQNIGVGKITVASPSLDEHLVLFAAIVAEQRLGIGEISAMILAKELGGIFISDDAKAIKKAAECGVRILDHAQRRDTVSFLKILLKAGAITKDEFEEARLLLINESFIF